MALFDYLKSTLLSKVVMAVTGVILVLFLIGHCIGNMQVYIGQETFNAYAHFLQGLGELLWVIRIVLFLCLVFHIITSIRLKWLDYKAKGQKYKIKKYLKATLTGRTMIWTGILVFVFLAFHLLHFTTGTIDSENFSKNNPEYYQKEVVVVEDKVQNEEGEIIGTKNQGIRKEYPDKILKDEVTAKECENIIPFEGKLYEKDDDIILFARPDAWSMVVKSFKQPFYSISYIILVIIVGFHLSHAIQSAFQTLGLNHPKYNGFYRATGPVLSTILVLCFISIPISVLTGLVGGCL
jgi:succinate dehydrogenase / fumarate reductase, cytochrome b subunit